MIRLIALFMCLSSSAMAVEMLVCSSDSRPTDGSLQRVMVMKNKAKKYDVYYQVKFGGQKKTLLLAQNIKDVSLSTRKPIGQGHKSSNDESERINSGFSFKLITETSFGTYRNKETNEYFHEIDIYSPLIEKNKAHLPSLAYPDHLKLRFLAKETKCQIK